MMMHIGEMTYDDDALVLHDDMGRTIRVPLPLDVYEELQARLLAVAKEAGQSEDTLSDDAVVAGLCTVLMGAELSTAREHAEKLEKKVDDLIAENDELRAKLEMPGGWTADRAPSYKDLVNAFVDANNTVVRLTTQLEQFVYKPEDGKKKPNYKELQGLNMRLKSDLYSANQTIDSLKSEIHELKQKLGYDDDDLDE